MKLGEKMLLALSREPGTGDYDADCEENGTESALSLLRREFPFLSRLIAGKKVVDYGCGTGRQAVALALEEGCTVWGIDTNAKTLQKAIHFAKLMDVPADRLSFSEYVPAHLNGSVDVIVSQNSMEHYSDPSAELERMKNLLVRGGRLLLTFGPPWFAPYGSHMHFFCKLPWLNIVFSEKTVMAVRQRFRSDGATRYEDVESGLNKMTLARFERLVRESRLQVEYVAYRCVKGLNSLGRLPLLRELFVNHVTCILVKPDNT